MEIYNNLLINNSLFDVWGIIVFFYFLFKDIVVAKVLKTPRIKLNPILTVLLAAIAIYLNSTLISEYNRYLNLTYIKGSIKLPPFSLIFICADFIAALITNFLFAKKANTSILTKPHVQFLTSVLTMLFVLTIFTNITSRFWLKQTASQINWDYTCFREQLSIDLADYYFRHGTLPDNLKDFTILTTNPANGSKLKLDKGDLLTIEISDENGNQVLVGHKDLIGIKIYKDGNQADYFKRFEAYNKSLCKNTLKIPTY